MGFKAILLHHGRIVFIVNVQTNVPALNAHRNLKSVGNTNATASQRLSSGYRINSAADDATGLAISEKMKAQIKGMQQSQKNTEDGISLIKTMDGGMDGIQEMMLRQRELIVQALNDTNTDEDRAKIQMEIDQLQSEIAMVADRVEFNKIKLLNRGSDATQGSGQGTPIHETTTTTTSVPIYRTEYSYTLDVIATQISHDVYASPAVDNNGYFNFFALNATGQTTQLLYADNTPTNNSWPGSSFPAIRADTGSGVYEFGLWPDSGRPSGTMTNQGTSYDATSQTWKTTYRMVDSTAGLDFDVVQRVSTVSYGSLQTVTVNLTAPDGTDLSGTYEYWDGGQSYCIEYEVINHGTADFTFDFMYNVDTAVGGNDSSPFVMPNGNTPLRSTTWEGNNIPDSIWMYNSITQPLVNVEMTFRNTGTGNYNFTPGSEPDKVSIGRYGSAGSNVSGFDYVGNNGTIGDSAYSVIWSNRAATAGSSSVAMATYFGVTSPPPDVLAQIGDIVESQVLDHYEERTETTQTLVGMMGTNPEEIEREQLWIQCGANSGQGMFIDLYDCRPKSLYKGVFHPSTITIDVNGKPQTVTLTKLVTHPQKEATASLIALDTAFGKVNTYRATAGAQQNRLEFTDDSLAVAFTNLEDAHSRIRDADMAKEMMALTKTNVLQQATVSMLAQANSTPQSVLQLLQ